MNKPCVVLYLVLATLIDLSAVRLHAAQPNILIIVGDDVGYGDVGRHGCRDIPTPNLDLLADSGVRCTNGYVSGTYCSPTRAGLLTGRYQTRFGYEFNPGAPGSGLPLSEKTLADRLKGVGYRTGIVGKWYLGNAESMRPRERGFEEFFGFLGGQHGYFDSQSILRGDEPVKATDYLTDVFAREAAAFIDRHRSEPWFLYVAFNAVHSPMQATDDRLAKFQHIQDTKRQKYNAMLMAMDDAIGTIRSKLGETGGLENTLIGFISDNGGPTMPGTAPNASVNTPLRGSKTTTLEGGIRVPFFVSWPARIKPMVYEKPVIQLDLHATALSAAGIDDKVPSELDGVNLLPFLSGEKTGTPHEALYWRFGDQTAVRIGDWKLVRYDSHIETNAPYGGTVTPPKLYNLASDIHEDHDLSATNPEKVKALQAA